MQIFIESATQYKRPIRVTFIDDKKALDTLEIYAVTNALRIRIYSGYINIIEKIYKQATLQIQVHETSEFLNYS